MRAIKVGDIVYVNYSPQKAGKVIEVRGTEDATVRWHNGKVSPHSKYGLGDLRELITDHERKLEKHRQMLAKLEAL